MCAFKPRPDTQLTPCLFPPQVSDENEALVELGMCMLLVAAILGNVTVLGPFIAIAAAYDIKLGSVTKQIGCAAVPPCRCPSRPPGARPPPSSSPPLWRPRATHGARQAPPITTIWPVAAHCSVTLAVYHP